MRYPSENVETCDDGQERLDVLQHRTQKFSDAFREFQALADTMAENDGLFQRTQGAMLNLLLDAEEMALRLDRKIKKHLKDSLEKQVEKQFLEKEIERSLAKVPEKQPEKLPVIQPLKQTEIQLRAPEKRLSKVLERFQEKEEGIARREKKTPEEEGKEVHWQLAERFSLANLDIDGNGTGGIRQMNSEQWNAAKNLTKWDPSGRILLGQMPAVEGQDEYPQVLEYTPSEDAYLERTARPAIRIPAAPEESWFPEDLHRKADSKLTNLRTSSRITAVDAIRLNLPPYNSDQYNKASS